MTTLQPGTQIGPYQIISQIGKGGMAVVYRAYHTKMERYVALKVVSTQLVEDPTFLQRFQQEARLIARLEHPHILPVHDYGETDGIPYMAMRFLEAGTLKERLSSGPLPLSEVDRIFSQLADALAYAHENGVIHRDIKPSNAMLDRRGDIFLTDFGIAKLIEGTAALTATGAITGTPAYMSPEQAQGQKVGLRSDIYSLGIVLYEMLTGKVPFEAETPLAVIFKQIQEPPAPISLVRPDLPYAIEALLIRALAKSPEDRFADMHEFLDAWKNAYSAAETIPSRTAPVVPEIPAPLPVPVMDAPIPQLEKPLSERRKRPVWLIPAGVVIVLILLVGGIWGARRQLQLRAWRQTYNETATTEAMAGIPPTAAPTTLAVTNVPPSSTVDSPTFTTWIGANAVYSLVPLGDKVYGVGVGGLSIWNKSDGKAVQFSTRDGLPEAWGSVVFRDPQDDSLWIGTGSGLAHFIDGKVVKIYNGRNGLDTDSVTAITRQGDKLIVGTSYCGGNNCGLQSFDGKVWQPFDKFPSAADPGNEQVSYNVNALMADDSGNLWVATWRGIAMLDTDGDWNVFTTESGLPDRFVFSLAMDGNSNVWAGTSHSGLVRFNPEKFEFESVIDLQDKGLDEIRGMALDHEDNLWLAGGWNAARYNPVSQELTVFSREDHNLPDGTPMAIAVDENNEIYIGTEGAGVFHYDGNKFIQWYIPDTISSPSYRIIVPGSDRWLYFASTYGGNVDMFSLVQGTWQWWGSRPEGAVPMAVDVDGAIWAGGSNGLWKIAGEKVTHFDTSEGLLSLDITAIRVTSDGAVYTLSPEGIVVFRDGNVDKVFHSGENGFPKQLAAMVAGSDGRIFVADEDGKQIGIYTPEKSAWEWIDVAAVLKVEPVAITDFALVGDGSLLVGTHGNGLYRLKDGQWAQVLSTTSGFEIPGDTINRIIVAPDDAVWVTTYWDGVVRYDGSTWKKLTMDDGLADNTVNDIYFAPDGTLWFATNSGITRMKP